MMSDLHTISSIVGRLITPLARRVLMTVSRGVVKLVDSAKKIQNLQVELVEDEVQDNVEHFEPYGFTSHPAVGAEALFLAVGGNRGHGIVPCVSDRRYRPKNLAEGDVCLHVNKTNGERVYLDAAGDTVNLGAKSAADWVAKATNTENRIAALEQFVTAMTLPSPMGPVGPPNIVPPAPFNTPAQGVAASKVKAT